MPQPAPSGYPLGRNSLQGRVVLFVPVGSPAYQPKFPGILRARANRRICSEYFPPVLHSFSPMRKVDAVNQSISSFLDSFTLALLRLMVKAIASVTLCFAVAFAAGRPASATSHLSSSVPMDSPLLIGERMATSTGELRGRSQHDPRRQVPGWRRILHREKKAQSTSLDATIALLKQNFYEKLKYSEQDWEEMKHNAEQRVLNRSLKRAGRMSKPGSEEWEHDEISALLSILRDPYTQHLPNMRFNAKILATEGGQYGLGCEMRRTWSTLYLRTIAMHAIGRLAAKTRSVSGDDPALTVVQAALAPGQSQLSSGNIALLAGIEIATSKWTKRRAYWCPVVTATAMGISRKLDVLQPLVISDVVAGSPAERVGLRPGDKVLAVDAQPYPTLDLAKVNDVCMSRARDFGQGRLREGQRVKFVIVREVEGSGGLAQLELLLVARQQPLVTLKWHIHDSEKSRLLGVLQLKWFSAETANEVQRALREMNSAGVDGLVLDLRMNGGGSLPAVADVASLFLPPDTDVMHIENSDGRVDTLRTVKRNLSIQDIPLVCVTDKETASAAEVLVGCLKDQGRSYILGERTYGKGVAQGLYRLPDGSGLAVSTLRIMTPSGLSYNKMGILPHETVMSAARIKVDELRPWRMALS